MKMKIRKSVIKLIVVIIIFICCSNPVMAMPKSASEETPSEKLRKKYEEINVSKNDYKNDLLCAEKIELHNKIEGIYGEAVINSENGKYVYDENYAGLYVENGNVVVCVTDLKKKYTDLDVKYELVDYSYNYLDLVLEEFDRKYDLYMKKAKENTKEYILVNSIVGYGINEEENRIDIDICDLNDEKAYEFGKLFGSNECFSLNNTGSLYEECDSYKPGRALYVINKREGVTIHYSIVSMGYRAYRKTSANAYQYGFVTCAHGVSESIDNIIYADTRGTKVGTIEAYLRSGTVDASFIKTVSGSSISTVVEYNGSGCAGNNSMKEYTYMTTVAKGETVYKVGCQTYKTSGKVKDKKYTANVGGVKLRNLTKTTVKGDHGDSGGIVFMNYNSYDIPAGILIGAGANSTYSVYVKATEIIDNMNVYPY